jgi:hypothetical protein
MKRIGYLYNEIISIENLYLAEKRAKQGKKERKDVLEFNKNLHDNIFQIHWQLRTGLYKTGKYYHFVIYEPKSRYISKLPYRDRVVHHAIINILEPIFVNSFVPNTYSCIKKRGILKALKDLNNSLLNEEETKYCLKMDIRKFYPSIDNDILKILIRRKFKDNKLLNLLDNIIESIPGLPLGSYTSQFFANFYLNGFNKWLLQEIKIKHLFVYCDDIVILHNNKDFLQELRRKIQLYLKENLKLSLSNYQVFPVKSRGIDYLGYKSFHNRILLRKSIKKRWIKMLKNNKNKKSKASYNGWLLHGNCINLQNKYLNKYENSCV